MNRHTREFSLRLIVEQLGQCATQRAALVNGVGRSVSRPAMLVTFHCSETPARRHIFSRRPMAVLRGFATETRGWVGGNSASTSLGTTNGGNTWFIDSIGYRINRFRLLSDSLGYASGQGVFKYSVFAPTGVREVHADIPPGSFVLLNVFPNPFNPQATIEYSLASGAEDPATPMYVRVSVHDVLGKEVSIVVNTLVSSGTYRVMLDGSRLASGIYFVKAEATAFDRAPLVRGAYVATNKVLLVR
jgi:hypothetical protein